MACEVNRVIDRAMESIDQLALPQALQDRIEAHKQNLSNLAAALLAGGHDIEQVRLTITTVLDSFKEELLRTLLALREDGNAR